jgi:hypothetical protein
MSAHANATGRSASVVRASTTIFPRALAFSACATATAEPDLRAAGRRLIEPPSASRGEGWIALRNRTLLCSISAWDAATTTGGQR